MAVGKKGNSSCGACPALCCSGLEERVKRPRTKYEIDNLLWQLRFENINYFIRNRFWYQLILGKCVYLDANNLCAVYERRPDICRDHNPPDCEYHGSIYDILFEQPADLEIFLAKEKRLKARKKK